MSHFFKNYFGTVLIDSDRPGVNIPSQLGELEERVPQRRTSKTPIQARHGCCQKTISNRHD